MASAYLLSEPTIFLGKYLYQVRNVLFFGCSVDWKLRWFLSVLSVFVDFPFWMCLGVRYHCYYLYSVVCQQFWRNVLPLFFPRYTGVKKTQHYKLFISNPIVLFWRTKKKTNSNITGRTVNALPKGVPVKCETKSKRNETKRNKSKRNSSKRNEIYRNETKSKRNEVNFVSFRWISFRFISFRFAFYRYTHKDAVFQWCLLDSKQTDIIFTSFLHFTLFSVKAKTE